MDSGSRTITQGQSASLTLAVQSTGGFNSQVNFYALNLPPGTAAGTSWNPYSLTPPANGRAQSTLTIFTGPSTATGNFSILLRAMDNSNIKKEITVTLTINPAVPSSFSTSVSTYSQTVTQGQNTNFTLNIQSSGGFNSPVALYALNLPPGYSNAYWSSSSVIPSANGQVQSTLFFTVTGQTPPGSYNITLRASSAGLPNRDLTVTVIVKGQTPSIRSLNPATPTHSSSNQVVDVYGSGFQTGLTVSISWGSGGTTLSGSQIRYIDSGHFQMIVTLGVGNWSMSVNTASGSSPLTYCRVV